MPPIAADKTYIQISWDTHIFSPSCIAVCTATVTLHLIRAIYLEYLDWLILIWLASGQKTEVQTLLLLNRILMTSLNTRYLFGVSWLADSDLIGLRAKDGSWNTAFVQRDLDGLQLADSNFRLLEAWLRAAFWWYQ